jgi:hypothetical protein
MRTVATVLLLGLLAVVLTGCSSLNTTRLEFHDDYYVREAVAKTFEMERTFPDGSTVTGTLTYNVTDVVWPAELPGRFAMSGTVAYKFEGRIVGRDAAFAAAPHAAIKKAMDPANVKEVFVERQLAVPNLVIVDTHWDKLKSLKLPIDFTTGGGKPVRFSSELHGQTMGWAIETALVWLKDIQVRCGLTMGGTYSLTAVDESYSWAKLSLVQKLPGGKSNNYTIYLMRGDSLKQIDATLADGSTLILREPI